MKTLSLSMLLAGILVTLNGCIPIAPPLIRPVAPYASVPYGGVPYGGVPYGGVPYGGVGGYMGPAYIGITPRIYGGFRGGHAGFGWGGHGRR